LAEDRDAKKGKRKTAAKALGKKSAKTVNRRIRNDLDLAW